MHRKIIQVSFEKKRKKILHGKIAECKGNSLAFIVLFTVKCIKRFQIWEGDEKKKKDKVTLQYINHNNM